MLNGSKLQALRALLWKGRLPCVCVCDAASQLGLSSGAGHWSVVRDACRKPVTRDLATARRQAPPSARMGKLLPGIPAAPVQMPQFKALGYTGVTTYCLVGSDRTAEVVGVQRYTP